MSRVDQARAKGWYDPATCTAQQMGETHRQAARRVDHERIAGRRMVAGDQRPRNKVGVCVSTHRSDGMNTAVRSHESVSSVISCSKRMAKSEQSFLPDPAVAYQTLVTHIMGSSSLSVVLIFRTAQ